jgi:antitoxin component YwqK of YwqJK toxin-antitoxin module
MGNILTPKGDMVAGLRPVDAEGRLHGECTNTWPGGRPALTVNYIGGQIQSASGQPAVTRWRPAGQLQYRVWVEGGLEHRGGDLPSSEYYYKTGEVKIRMWCRHGRQHRKGSQPASIKYEKSGAIIGRKYYAWGKLHARNGPAVFINDGGVVASREYHYGYKHGQCTKSTAEAMTTCDYRMGLKHGIWRKTKGDTTTEIHYKRGRLHRRNGPAKTVTRGGQVICEEHWCNGQQI